MAVSVVWNMLVIMVFGSRPNSCEENRMFMPVSSKYLVMHQIRIPMKKGLREIFSFLWK